MAETRFLHSFFGERLLDYHKLIVWLRDLETVKLEFQRPKVINGVFGVPKDKGTQSLVIDALNGTWFFKPAQKFTCRVLNANWTYLWNPSTHFMWQSRIWITVFIEYLCPNGCQIYFDYYLLR